MESVYNKIINPLNIEENMNKILEAYAKSANGEDFYSELLNRKIDLTNTYENGYDRYYVKMFHRWRDSFNKVKKEDFLSSDGISKKYPFELVKSYLNEVVSSSTRKKVDEIMTLNIPRLDPTNIPPNLKFLLDANRWDAKGKHSKWEYATSINQLAPINKKTIDFTEILYVNVNREKLYEFINVFIKECDERNLPFSYKFSKLENRSDAFQIFSNTLNIDMYYEILQDIKNKYPKLIGNNTPLLAGKISDGIAYSHINTNNLGYFNLSYMELSTLIIEDAFKVSTAKWLIEHKDFKIDYNGSQVPLYEFLSLKIAERCEGNPKFVVIDLNNMKDLDKKTEVDKDKFKSRVYQESLKTVGEYLFNFQNANKSDPISISEGGYEVKYDEKYLYDIMKELTPLIYSMEPKYKEEFRSYIDIRCEELGIDKNMFCMNKTIDQLEIDSQLESEMKL